MGMFDWTIRIVSPFQRRRFRNDRTQGLLHNNGKTHPLLLDHQDTATCVRDSLSIQPIQSDPTTLPASADQAAIDR